MAMDTLLEEALEAWGYTRAGVVSELENLPVDAMGHRPAPGVRSVAELVHHIAESGLLMAGELAREDGDFTRQPYARHLAEHAGAMKRPGERTELLELLRTSHTDGEARLRAAGELRLLAPIRRFDGQVGTRLA
ncbi:MAG TPA: DinB family protein, partial [Longimicrobiales bacterium]|nr:DinB family protein [Longimicrobiales bacterium]